MVFISGINEAFAEHEGPRSVFYPNPSTYEAKISAYNFPYGITVESILSPNMNSTFYELDSFYQTPSIILTQGELYSPTIKIDESFENNFRLSDYHLCTDKGGVVREDGLQRGKEFTAQPYNNYICHFWIYYTPPTPTFQITFLTDFTEPDSINFHMHQWGEVRYGIYSIDIIVGNGSSEIFDIPVGNKIRIIPLHYQQDYNYTGFTCYNNGINMNVPDVLSSSYPTHGDVSNWIYVKHKLQYGDHIACIAFFEKKIVTE